MHDLLLLVGFFCFFLENLRKTTPGNVALKKKKCNEGQGNYICQINDAITSSAKGLSVK